MVKATDLSVGDGDDVGRNVGRHITGLSLDDRQSGEGTTAVGIAHLGRTLEETRVKIEDIAGVSLRIDATRQSSSPNDG